jgi:organic radical activating enzyme
MTVLKNTISLCPTCLIDIPATIHEIDGMAVMRKTCPEHGLFNGIVERDVEHYKRVLSHNSPAFYEGLIIDITYRCNLRCKWCYQHLDAYNVPTERIYTLASQMPKGYNIILSGGEPTLRTDLPDIVNHLVEMGYCVNLITNGLHIDWSLPCEWTLSHHPESEELFMRRILEARNEGRKFVSIIYTDNSLDDFYTHFQQALEWQDICSVFRMHSAAPVGGNLADQTAGVFVSDMFNLLIGKGHNIQAYPPKTIFLPLVADGVKFMLISWSTAANVDVMENFAEPWYHGKGNTVDNLVTRIIRDA